MRPPAAIPAAPREGQVAGEVRTEFWCATATKSPGRPGEGYEYSKGRFVVPTKQDFEAAAVEKTKRVDIIDFVEASETTIATSKHKLRGASHGW